MSVVPHFGSIEIVSLTCFAGLSAHKSIRLEHQCVTVFRRAQRQASGRACAAGSYPSNSIERSKLPPHQPRLIKRATWDEAQPPPNRPLAPPRQVPGAGQFPALRQAAKLTRRAPRRESVFAQMSDLGRFIVCRDGPCPSITLS